MPDIINTGMLDSTRELMGDQLPLMSEYFFEDAVGYIDSIRQGVRENNIDKIRDASHTIKSSSLQIGAEVVSEIAASMEEKSINGVSIDELSQMSDDLESELAKAQEQIKNYL